MQSTERARSALVALIPALERNEKLSYCISNERWVIEAKGSSKAISVDFNTFLNQLLKRMADDERAHFGFATPAIHACLRQLGLINSRGRRSLTINWLLTGADGKVTVIGPSGPLPPLTAGET